MSNDITVIDQNELAAFADEIGANADAMKGGTYLPTLKVNYNEDNPETGKELKRGVFFLTNQDVTVYSKTAVIRPLMQVFQWTKYDELAKKTLNRTKLVTNFGEQARDELGTEKCGKPAAKLLKADPALAKRYEDITCYRQIYALVSYDGTDEDGNEHSVKDVLATLRLKGANFMPFQEEFIAFMPRDSRLWDFTARLGVTKEKNDPTSATSFYIIHFDGDFKTKLPLTTPIFETLMGLKSNVDDINNEIDKKYFASLTAKSVDDSAAAIRALDITPNVSKVDTLANDFVDEIPF